jgi:two-component sensor histidine kinase
VHHRVKNSLPVIISLLQLQAGRVRNPEFHGFLRDTRNRVRSMALLHVTLYRSGNPVKISLPPVRRDRFSLSIRLSSP